jgi:hypothetical protein
MMGTIYSSGLGLLLKPFDRISDGRLRYVFATPSYWSYEALVLTELFLPTTAKPINYILVSTIHP